jgi:hypothetical protein
MGDQDRKPPADQSATRDRSKQDDDRQEREEILRALLHPDRAQHDELGRMDLSADEAEGHPSKQSSPREQGAGPLDLTKVDE